MLKSMSLKAAPATTGARFNKRPATSWHSNLRGSVGTAVIGGAIAVIGAFEVGTTGALNGGTIPPASAFTPLKTWVQTNFLGSDWVLVIGFMALVALVWSLMHGKGWAGASVVLGILAAALLGPNLVIAAATATRDPAPIVSHVDQAPKASSTSTITVPARAASSKLAVPV